MVGKWHVMMMGDDNRVERPLMTNKHDFYGVDPFDLKIGQELESWDPRAYLRCGSRADDGDADDQLFRHACARSLNGRESRSTIFSTSLSACFATTVKQFSDFR